MRVAGALLAVLLIAACPPRRARVAYAVPSLPVPVTPAPVPPARAVDPAVERLLGEWEKRLDGVTSLRTEVTLKHTDAIFKKETNFRGTALGMKPNYLVLRLDNVDDPKKLDYEAYICDGKSLFAYNGLQKTITEVPLPAQWPANRLWVPDAPILELLLSVNAKDAAGRFDISLFKTDEHYVYLDIKPRTGADRRAFEHLRLALYRPGAATEALAYLPARVYVRKPDGNSELWTFTNPQTNVPGVGARMFRFVPVNADGWKVQKLPAVGAP